MVITNGNCSTISVCTTVAVTGTEDSEGRNAFEVYPNPFNEVFTVRTGTRAGTIRVELFNADGRMVLDETHGGLEVITMQTAHLPQGSYMLRLTTHKASITRSVVAVCQ